MDELRERVQQDTTLAEETGGQTAGEAARALAEQATKLIADLQRLARQEAEARRGQPDWGAWAKLANAARGGALQLASCRDAAREVVRREREASA